MRVEAGVVWTYRTPFDEVAGIRGYVCFGQDRVSVELEDGWPGEEIAFHGEVDVTGWLLYANHAVYAGRGLARGRVGSTAWPDGWSRPTPVRR